MGDEREGLPKLTDMYAEMEQRAHRAEGRVGQLTKERDDFKLAMMEEADRALKEDARAEVAERRVTELEAALQLKKQACARLVLTWRCETCGWETTLPVPGFGGDGRYHYPDGRTPCGPLSARRAVLSTNKEETA